MRKSRFTESQIEAALKEADAGVTAAQLARKRGTSAATFYQWRAKSGGMEATPSSVCTLANILSGAFLA